MEPSIRSGSSHAPAESARRPAPPPPVPRGPYFLWGMLLAIVFALPDVTIDRSARSGRPLIQELAEPSDLLTWRRPRVGEREWAARLDVGLDDVLATERVLNRLYSRPEGTGWGRPGGFAFELGGLRIAVHPRALLAAVWAAVVAYSLHMRRRLGHKDALIAEERRKRDDLRATRDAKIEELTRINKKMNQMQAKLVTAEKLASIGRLSATLAHEIRNPLTIIQTSAGLIADENARETPTGQAAEIIAQEVRRLNGIITDLLNFARPKPPRLGRHSLNDTVHGFLTPLVEELARKRIDVAFIPGEIAEDVLIDPDQFYQVLLNTLWNARDAVLENGGGRIEILTMHAGHYAQVEIRDSGPGMTPAVLSQVSEPFYTTKTQGTGLGIPVCIQLMEGMGGAWSVWSRPEEGCRVTLSVRTVPVSTRGDTDGHVRMELLEQTDPAFGGARVLGPDPTDNPLKGPR